MISAEARLPAVSPRLPFLIGCVKQIAEGFINDFISSKNTVMRNGARGFSDRDAHSQNRPYQRYSAWHAKSIWILDIPQRIALLFSTITECRSGLLVRGI